MTANSTTTIETAKVIRARDPKTGRFVKAMPLRAATAEINEPVVVEPVLAKISEHYQFLFDLMKGMTVGQTVQVFARNADKSVCKAFGIIHRMTKTNLEKNVPELAVALFNADNWHHECSGTDCRLYETVDDISDFQVIPFGEIYQIVVQRNQRGTFWQVRLTF